MESRSNSYLFICGDSTPGENDLFSPTKSILLASLASNWAVRTHYEANGADPRSDKAVLFRNIASAHAFLYIFSEETTMNVFYLNQLGIAFARGVPIVGIREPSYLMPNPLPEHYYSTEIVNLNEGRSNDSRNRPTSRGKAVLSNVLIESFCNAVVYTVDFHKSCLERLFRKVTDAFVRSEKERSLPPSLTITDYARSSVKGGEASRQKLWTCFGGLTKCPKCGTAVKTTRQTSVLRKTNSVDNLFKKDQSSPAAQQQHVDRPQLLITKSVLQPVVVQPNFSKAVFQTGSRRPATSIVRKASARAGLVEARLAKNDVSESRPTSSKSCNAIPDAPPQINTSNELEARSVAENIMTEKSNVQENASQFVRRKTSTTGFITKKRGAFLRKMTSLPCIPTTYLVTDPSSEEPAFVKYPLAENLSDCATNVPEFTDDEDKETIHISRRPSPAISTCSTNIE